MREYKPDALEIVRRAGMSDRPGFYSGRGAILSDLNSKILEKVYQEIQEGHGEEPANQFVQMVAEVPKLSATDFLLALYQLEANNWKYDKKGKGSEKGVYFESEGEAWGTITSVLGGMSERDETRSIRGEFLRNHGVDQDTPKIRDCLDY